MKVLKDYYCFKCHSKQDFVPLLHNPESGVEIGVYSCKGCGATFTIMEQSEDKK
jgi:DNA-directed RNA polymerase subunit RPC12/RpoP